MKVNPLPIDRINELFDVDTQNGRLIRKVSRGGGKARTVIGGRKQDVYVQIMIDGKYYMVHRIIYSVHHNIVLTPDDQIDHINHKKSDNRIINLRTTSGQNNCQHRKTHKDRPYGVHYHKKYKKWCAEIVKTKTHPTSFKKAGYPTMQAAYEVVRVEHHRIRGTYPINDAYWKVMWNLP